MARFDTLNEFKKRASQEDWRNLQRAYYISRKDTWDDWANEYGFSRSQAEWLLRRARLIGYEFSELRRQLRAESGYRGTPKTLKPKAATIIAAIKSETSNNSYYLLIRYADGQLDCGCSPSESYIENEFDSWIDKSETDVLKVCENYKAVLEGHYKELSAMYMRERLKKYLFTLQHLAMRIKVFDTFIDLLKSM